MAEQKSSSTLTAPLERAASAVRKVPGGEAVTRAGQEVLDKIGAVSPRGRRLAVYTGAGVLGVAGVVEWPVALTGAAVAWLTQSRPGASEETKKTSASGTATTHAPEAGGKGSAKGAGRSASAKRDGATASRGAKSAKAGAAGVSPGPTARPGRTTR